MTPMTAADVFSKVRQHFSQPNAELAVIADETRCVYRSGNDPASPLRCAFGAVIPDEMYDSDMESTSAFSVLENYPALAALFDDDARDLIGHLQATHDEIARGAGSVEDFLTALAHIEAEW